MNKLVKFFGLVVLTLGVSKEANAVPVNYSQLFNLSNVSLGSCGMFIHTGASFMNPEVLAVTASSIAASLNAFPLANLTLLIDAVDKSDNNKNFTHQGGGLFTTIAKGGSFTLKGDIAGKQVTLLQGTYQATDHDPNTPDSVFSVLNNAQKPVVWNTLLNVTSGVLYDFLGGQNYSGGVLQLFQAFAGYATFFNGKDFIVPVGQLSLYGPNAVPEPISSALLLSGLGAVAIRRRKASKESAI